MDETGWLDSFEAAKRMVRENEADCVVLKSGAIVHAGHGRGVGPLVRLYDSSPETLYGAVVVDKVIGRAAAFMAILGGAVHVHGLVMGRGAEELLAAHGIEASHDRLVECIMNRSNDGPCPLEAAVSGIQDPEEALVAIRTRIAELMKGIMPQIV